MGNFIINPDLREVEECDLNLVVAGTEDAVAMVEGSAQEMSEADLLEAIDMAHAEIKRLCQAQHEFRTKAGKEKRTFEPPVADEELKKQVKGLVIEKIKESIVIPDKMRRQAALDADLREVIEKINSEDNDRTKEIVAIFDDLEKGLVRSMILNDNMRADGRKPDEIRQISSDVSILPRTHGSALFIRGETQCLAVVTLGTADDEQRIDSL
jgi:polyribonucleotide nucleotidyltransferase